MKLAYGNKKLSCIAQTPARRLVARCIELPGCLSEGKTETEALKNIQDAIKVYLEDVEAEAKEKKAKLVQVTV